MFYWAGYLCGHLGLNPQVPLWGTKYVQGASELSLQWREVWDPLYQTYLIIHWVRVTLESVTTSQTHQAEQISLFQGKTWGRRTCYGISVCRAALACTGTEPLAAAEIRGGQCCQTQGAATIITKLLTTPYMRV